LSTQGAQTPSDEPRLKQEFEQFLSERQQAPTARRDRETLLAQFKKFVEFKNAQAKTSRDGTQRFEIWQALDATNLHELASASSTAIGTVAKGSRAYLSHVMPLNVAVIRLAPDGVLNALGLVDRDVVTLDRALPRAAA
jgi:hypothetical protein